MADTFWRSLLLSPALGLAVGGIGGRLLALSLVRRWVAPDWRPMPPLPWVTAAKV